MPGTIWGEKVGIRLLRPGDAGALERFISDPDVANLLFEELDSDIPSPLLMGAIIVLQRLQGSPDYGIVEPGGRLVGSVRLWRISEKNRSAMLTIFIGDKSRWGQGYGTEALRLILRHAFGQMRLNRVELHVFDFNARAIRSYEKAGFVREGVRRHALRRGTRYYDIVVMGILKEEFETLEAQRERKDSPHGGENTHMIAPGT